MKRPTDQQLEAFDRTWRMGLTELREEFEKLKGHNFQVTLGDVAFDAEVLRVTHVECLTDTGRDHVRVRFKSSQPYAYTVHVMHYAAQGLYDDVQHQRTFGTPKSSFDKFNFGRSISITLGADDCVQWVFELEFF